MYARLTRELKKKIMKKKIVHSLHSFACVWSVFLIGRKKENQSDVPNQNDDDDDDDDLLYTCTLTSFVLLSFFFVMYKYRVFILFHILFHTTLTLLHVILWYNCDTI